MDFLSKTLPTYCYDHGGYSQVFGYHDVQWDEYEEYPMAEVNGEWVSLTPADDIPARWWTVGVYTSYQVYGGPEEGGWWYAAGSLTEHGRMRFFDSFEEAQAYSDELWSWVDVQNAQRDRGDEKLTVRCTTEALPDTHYPRKRPYYS